VGRRLLLDACVLFPPLVRGIILSVAEAGSITPLWSQRILDEWRIAILRKQGAEAEEKVAAIQERMADSFPEALVGPDPNVEAEIDLPDPADAHVVAAAAAEGVPGILTFNLRDFPRRALWPYGIEAHHPDSVLWLLLSEDRDAMKAPVTYALNSQNIPVERHRKALKRARLPRFGKAWEDG